MKVKYKNEVVTVHNYNSISKTINIMNDMESNSLKDVGFLEFMKSNFSYLAKEKNIFVTIYKIRNWIFKNIKYKNDMYDETLISPRIIIYIRQGDCDDFALLTKTMLRFFNIKVKYILLAKSKNDYTHIANVFEYKKEFQYIDATMNKSIFPKQYLYYKII